MLLKSLHRMLGLVVAASVGACAGTPVALPEVGSLATVPSFKLDRQAVIQRWARPDVWDWSTGRATTREADRLRAVNASHTESGKRRLMALSSLTNVSSVGYNGSASTGRITSAAAHHFGTDEAFWITDTGWLLKRNMTSGVVAAFKLKEANNTTNATDTFVGSAVGLSSDGARVYVTSKEGRFFAVKTSDGLNVTSSPLTLGGTSTSVTVAPPVYVDPLASFHDGTAETIYAMTQTGTLRRITYAAGAIAQRQTYSAAELGMVNSTTYTELCRTGPVVLGGRAVITTWHKHASNAGLDRGNVIYFNTGATGFTTATTAGSLVRKVGLASPVWAPPAIETDNDLVPRLAFVPSGYVVAMVDFATGDRAETVSLLVNQTTPTSGVLSTYDYGASGATDVEIAPETGGAVSIANDTTTVLPRSGSWLDTAQLYAAIGVQTSYKATTPVWAYIRYYVDEATHLTVGGTVRAVLNARVKLTATQSSNRNGNQNSPTPLAVRSFLVSPYLAGTTTPWTQTNITPTNRPPFSDGLAFNFANLNSHSGTELLPNAGNSFRKNDPYYWSAKGLVASGDEHYSFGFAQENLLTDYEDGSNGQPHQKATPVFSGGTGPGLVVTRSGEGLSNPTMSNAVTIDSFDKRIFAVNTNALYVIQYRSATYDGGASEWTTSAFSERRANFSDGAQTHYCLTQLGRTAGVTPITTTTIPKRYVDNVTAPLWTGSFVYVQDNHGVSNKSTVSRFSAGTAATGIGALAPGSAPTQLDFVDLTAAAADAKCGATHLTYSPAGRLFAGTWDTTTGSNNGRTWVLSLQ